MMSILGPWRSTTLNGARDMDIGLVLMISDRKELGRPYSWIETRDLAQRAEAAGFDSLWLYDHLLYRDPDEPTIGIWECWTFLSALAEATTRPQIGTLVNCLPFRNPAILAKMAVTLDEVSNGRFILGIGAGWNAAEFEAFGLPFDHRMSRFAEAVKIIQPLLAEGRVDFQGTYYTATNCALAPRGPRPNGPPLLFGTWGPRGLRLTAEYGDLWNSGYRCEEAGLREAHARLEAACREVRRDPATLAKTTMIACTFPDLGGPDKLDYDSLSGTPEQLAERFLALEHLGIVHIMLEAHPYSAESLDRLAEAVRLYRERSANE
jgi:probable F420-dependent oxidoreductase